MVLVDKENVKGYVQMDEKEHTKKLIKILKFLRDSKKLLD